MEVFAVLLCFEESLLRFVCEQESQMQSSKEPHLAREPQVPDRCFRGSLPWNTIGDEIKLSPSLEIFKKEIRSWNDANCTCFIYNYFSFIFS